MDFFEVITARRSIRKFKPDPIPDEIMHRAFNAATLAPNSSNLQTWDFFWVKSSPKKTALVKYCFNQSAARTAAELIVVCANPKQWNRSNSHIVDFAKRVNAPKQVLEYYQKFIPDSYDNVFFRIKELLSLFLNLIPVRWQPIKRAPITSRSLQEVAIKSAALGCQNLVMALQAQGYSSCMMEGFAENKVLELLELKSPARVVMIIAAGISTDRGTWGPQFRIPQEQVVHTL